MRQKTRQRPRATEISGFYQPGDLVERLSHGPKEIDYKNGGFIPYSQYGVGIVVCELEDTIRNYVEVFWQGTGKREQINKKFVKRIPKVARYVSHKIKSSKDTESKDS